MNDISFIETLKQKRKNHLEEIEKLQRLIKSIDNLISEYSGSLQEDAQIKIPVVSDPAIPDDHLLKMNLTQAIVEIMKTKPHSEWRGSEIKKALKKKSYNANNLGAKISSRLVERVKHPSCKWVRIEHEDYPTYKLKEAYIEGNEQ